VVQVGVARTLGLGMSKMTSVGDDRAAAEQAGPHRPARVARGRHHRKHEMLTRSHPAVVRSISDAVVIKDGEPFFLCPPDGQIPIDGVHGFGLYHHDTRFLSGYEVRILGKTPESLVATAAAGTMAVIELTNAKIHLAEGRTIAKNLLGVRWSRALDGDRAELHDKLTVHNYDRGDLSVRIGLELAARFEDIFEVRDLLHTRRGATATKAAWSGDQLVFADDGKDRVRRTLTVSFDPSPSARSERGAEVEVPVPGRGSATLEVRLQIGEEVEAGGSPIERRSPPTTAQRPPATAGPRADAERAWAGVDGWRTAVRSSAILFDAVLARSLDDLLLLRGELAGRRYYAAGVPWFATLFGRDSLIAAYQTLAFDPSLAADTLRLLAGRQGTEVDDWRDEQPGKILHELRVGELARLDEIPQTPYYGTVDATPLFLMLLGEHARWTGSLDLFRDLGGNVERALGWIDRRGAAHGEGYLEYLSATDRGLANQGWKDSGDGIVDADGRIAEPPIALAEVQGYVFAAKRAMAELFERNGQPERAASLRLEANGLRQRFERDFWSDDLGCYVMALQKDRRPCAVVSSNAGQVLLSGIASAAHAGKVASRLMADDMFNGWGIRTLSTAAAAYNPIGYHLGTVWPHDNSLIAAGLRHYALDGPAERILESLVEAAADFAHQRLPECFAGLERSTFGVPVRYPVACHPQAWAAGSVPHLLAVTLGLQPDGFERRLRIVRPQLPSFVDRLEIRGLPVAEARVDLEFRRSRDGVAASVTHVEGELEVEIDREARDDDNVD